MDQMPPEMQEPMAAEAEAPAAGKTVCIEMTAEGGFSVYMKGEEPPASMGPGAAPQGEQAASIDEALEMAKTMLEGEPSEEMSVEQAFQGGFNGEQPKAGKGMY